MCNPVANYMAPYPINNRQQHPATNKRVTIPEAVVIQFVLLRMSRMLL